MNVDYNDAGPSTLVETVAESTEAGEPVVPVAELSPEEQAMNLEEGVKGSGEPSRRRPGCDGYVTVNENDAWYAVLFSRQDGADRQYVDVRTSSSGQASRGGRLRSIWDCRAIHRWSCTVCHRRWSTRCSSWTPVPRKMVRLMQRTS
jgi:hypothetical protein